MGFFLILKINTMSRSSSIALSIAVYLFTLVLVYLTFGYTRDYPVLVRIGVADLAGTIVIFIFSVLLNNSSMYDPYWSVKPLVIAGYYFLLTPINEASLVEGAALFLVFLYALRLTANFYRGWPGLKHEDWRYRNFRKQFPRAYWAVSFFGIHFFPTVMVYLGCLPMLVIFEQPVEYPVVAIFGLFVLLGSVILAYVADEQLRTFRMKAENDGKTINTGLWSRSRHPNYLGEILTWWGLFIVALGCGVSNWWTGLGALVITLMFVFISIPMMERYAEGKRADYLEYKQKVPFLLPLKF